METITIQLGPKGQIVVPKVVRERLGLAEGDALMLIVDGRRVILRARPKSFTDATAGLHPAVWANAEGWLERERDAWD